MDEIRNIYTNNLKKYIVWKIKNIVRNRKAMNFGLISNEERPSIYRINWVSKRKQFMGQINGIID